MYLIDFKQKEGRVKKYPTLSAILQKNPLFSTGSFCFCRYFVFRMNCRRFRTAVFFRQSVGCRVRRAVINNDDFKIGKRLRQNAVHRFVNERALVIAGITTFDSKVRGRIPNFAKRANFQRILKIVLCSICISDIYKLNGRFCRPRSLWNRVPSTKSTIANRLRHAALITKAKLRRKSASC